MSDKIAEIKERHLHDEHWRNSPSMICPQSHADRATLLAEVDRHRAENERLLQAVGLATTAVPHMQVDIENPVGMMQRVVAEVERLRAMLPPTAHSGVRNGPGEGSWAVFAEKMMKERDEARAELDRTHALLKDPNAVAVNMLRGVIALPSADQIKHIYQQALEAKP